jgi:hypothetical protein
MRTLPAFALALLTIVPAASSPLFGDSVQGVYKVQHKIAMYDGSLPPGQFNTVEDVMEIVALPRGEAYLRLRTIFDNGHICALRGIARTEGDALVYRPHDNIQGKCVLTLQRKGDRLVFGDRDGACKYDFCGMRGRFDGESFPLSSRRPIRYMPRLVASREYAEAMAEQGQSAPPPAVAVKVEPMQIGGSVPRYPRLVAFPDPAIRARVNALFAKAEIEDHKDRDDCLANLRASHLDDPEPYDVRIDVSYVTAHYISMQIRRSYNCGGPYPNNGVPDPRTIDLSTATDVNWQWVFKPGFLDGPSGGDGRLARLYRRRYASAHGKDPDCARAVAEQALNFSLRLDSRRGLMAEPSFPHALQACAEEIAIAPAEIAPYVQDARFLADLKATVRT